MMNDREQSLLDLHQQRAAALRASMLLIELGAGIRVDAPREQPAAVELPAKGGAS
jgi:hypothetical protein